LNLPLGFATDLLGEPNPIRFPAMNNGAQCLRPNEFTILEAM
jgi:hypothetical protein